MKIAIVTGLYPPIIGGAGAVMHGLATHGKGNIEIITTRFDRMGHRIVTATGDPGEQPHVNRISRLERRLAWFPPGKIRGLLQAGYDRFLLHPKIKSELLLLLDRLQPDLICLGTPTCWWVVNEIPDWKPNAKVIFYVHGEEVPRGMNYHQRLRLSYLRRACAVVAVSAYTKNALVKAGLGEERIFVVTNGVDTKRFQPGARSQAIVSRYSIGKRPVLLTLARLDERKGQDMMIRALPKVRQAIPNVVYLVAGEGECGPRLRALVTELHLEDSVIFTGSVNDDEVVHFYRTCDVYVMPNRTTADGDTEGFGLVFLEAGACAKAVIGGNAGGVPDAIQNEVTGLLVDGTSPDAIADACLRLLQDDNLRETLGANGLLNAQRNDWREKAEQFLALCKWLAEE